MTATMSTIAASGTVQPLRKILAVDDDPVMAHLIERILCRDGYAVDVAVSAEDAKARVNVAHPDLILLDVQLADGDGVGLMSDLRQERDVPIILVSGRSGEADRVRGLRLGADDYVVKPFSHEELSARVGAVLRRLAPRQCTPRLRFGSLAIDAVAREVWLGDRPVDVTAKEFDLLAFLADNPRHAFTRGQLLQHVWKSSANWQDPATVTEHVRRLRHKLDDDSGPRRWIQTVRRVGYRFEP